MALAVLCPGPAFFLFRIIAIQGCEFAEQFLLTLREVGWRLHHDVDNLVAASSAADIGYTTAT